MIVLIKPSGKKKNYLVTIAIGKKYFDVWKKFCYPTWSIYCKKNNLGLIVIDKYLIDKSHKNFKKATWHKWLIGSSLLNQNIKVDNVCSIDSDFLINPFSPNIFYKYNENKFGLVSKRKQLPYFSRENTLKRISFFRNRYYSSSYPLDSAIFISLKDLYSYHKFKVQNDEACSGLIIFNVKKHSKMMKKWFHLYDKNTKSITGDGDQTHTNYHILKTKKVQWLDYRFQALWQLEMANFYPFLYQKEFANKKNISSCIEASMLNNYFLHFAGSWGEAQMYKYRNIFIRNLKIYEKLNKYYSKKVSGKPKGVIKPK